MSKTERLSIGSFSLLTGLSIPSLRHYDAIGLLEPASIDPSSRYRYYRRGQVPDGRIVRALRALELPLGDIKEILQSGDEAYTRECLIAHRERLLAQADLLRDQLATLNDFIEKGVPVAAAQGNRIVMINIAVD